MPHSRKLCRGVSESTSSRGDGPGIFAEVLEDRHDTHMRLKNPDDGLDMVVPLDTGNGLKEMRNAVIRSSELRAGSQFEGG